MDKQREKCWIFAIVIMLSALLPYSSWAQIEIEVFPLGRAVQVGGLATAFAEVENTMTVTAIGCTITPLTPVPGALFLYAPVDPVTSALIGPANTPVDIPAGTTQKFNITFVPGVALAPIDVQFEVVCANTTVAPIATGINTLLLSASLIPPADMVALTSAPGGIVTLPSPTATEPFLIASLNLGASDLITMSADTGAAGLPLTLLVCEFNASIGNCMAPPSPTTTKTINTGEITFYAVFVVGQGTPIPLNPTINRVFVRFSDSDSVNRGLTGVAVEASDASFPNVAGNYSGSGALTVASCPDPADNLSLPFSGTATLSQISESLFSGEANLEASVDGETVLAQVIVSQNSPGQITSSGVISGTLTFIVPDPDPDAVIELMGPLMGQLSGDTLTINIPLPDPGNGCSINVSMTLTR